jgi:hypothetical protein
LKSPPRHTRANTLPFRHDYTAVADHSIVSFFFRPLGLYLTFGS